MRVRIVLEVKVEEGQEASQDAIREAILADFIYGELWVEEGGKEGGYSVTVLPEVEFLTDPADVPMESVALPAEDVKA